MNPTAIALDSIVEALPQLKSLVAATQGISDSDLRNLIEGCADPKIKGRTAHVGSGASIEYAKTLLAAFTAEVEAIADLTDLDKEFPEVVETSSPESVEHSEVPAIQESVTSAEPSDDVTVDVQIDGEGVKVVADDDSKLYLVLPEKSVLKLSEASAEEKEQALKLASKL